MDQLERAATWVMDCNALWWPFVDLRPPRDRPITTTLVAMLAVSSVLAPALVLVFALVLGGARIPRAVLVLLSLTTVLTPLVIFAGLKVGAAFWNRRARRLGMSPN